MVAYFTNTGQNYAYSTFGVVPVYNCTSNVSNATTLCSYSQRESSENLFGCNDNKKEAEADLPPEKWQRYVEIRRAFRLAYKMLIDPQLARPPPV